MDYFCYFFNHCEKRTATPKTIWSMLQKVHEMYNASQDANGCNSSNIRIIMGNDVKSVLQWNHMGRSWIINCNALIYFMWLHFLVQINFQNDRLHPTPCTCRKTLVRGAKLCMCVSVPRFVIELVRVEAGVFKINIHWTFLGVCVCAVGSVCMWCVGGVCGGLAVLKFGISQPKASTSMCMYVLNFVSSTTLFKVCVM